MLNLLNLVITDFVRDMLGVLSYHGENCVFKAQDFSDQITRRVALLITYRYALMWLNLILLYTDFLFYSLLCHYIIHSTQSLSRVLIPRQKAS